MQPIPVQSETAVLLVLCAGNHKCCVCKKPVHATFCSTEFEQIRDTVRDKFMNKETGQPPEKVGIAMDVCHTCIEKAETKQSCEETG